MSCRLRLGVISLMAGAVLASACVAWGGSARDESLVDVTRLKTYRVEDASGSLLLEVDDILLDEATGQIGYLVVEPNPSGFGLDLHTAPAISGRSIPVPWRLVNLDPAHRRMVLAVGADVLLDAPYLGNSAAPLREAKLADVERFWLSHAGSE